MKSSLCNEYEVLHDIIKMGDSALKRNTQLYFYIGLLLMIISFAVLLSACSQMEESSPTWQEQYDLGVRYLSEGNYEEAIIAFTAAIEIDPKRPEAYGKAAESYVGLGDLEAAADILEQGYAATGDSSLEEQLVRLKESMGAEEQEEEAAYQPVSPEAMSGTLSLSDMESSYEIGGPNAEYNEGAIGGMNLRFTVNGPAEVREVNIWAWSPTGIQDSEIPRLVAEAVEIWKSEGVQIGAEKEIPFEGAIGFPVWEEDRNTTVYVLLVGLDAEGNAVGHTVVAVAIP